MQKPILDSPTISGLRDIIETNIPQIIGGVRLGINEAQAILDAYGSLVDPENKLKMSNMSIHQMIEITNKIYIRENELNNAQTQYDSDSA